MSDEIVEIEARDADTFRAWLEQHHETASAVWLIFWKKGSGRPSIVWSEAVDQALCFGWIDSKAQSLDANRYRQYFSPRRPGSAWSRINKDKIADLAAAGLIAPAGLAAIERAKADGSWTILDGPEAGIIPDDFGAALDEAELRQVYTDLTAGTRKAILAWLATAKREATRANRIAKTIASLEQGKPPFG